MAASNRAVFLDFDGVLFDTASEAYVVAMLTLHGKIPDLDSFRDSVHYDSFIKHRYLIGPAWNYYYLFKLLDGQVDLDEFNKLIDLGCSTECKKFEENFFENRKRLQDEDYESWLALNFPYDFYFMSKEILQDPRVFIVTTKDPATVLKLLETEGVSFDKSRLFGKDDFAVHETKSALIRELMTKLKTVKALFVDDSITHLHHCKGIEGLELAQPEWGYVEENSLMTMDSETINKKVNCVLGL